MSVPDEEFMRLALEQARCADALGEVPVGAVVVFDSQIIGAGFNQSIALEDPTAHAEIVAIREAADSVGNYRLTGATLYTTIEPCLMCAGAIIHARLSRVVYGADDPKAGAVRSLFEILDDPRLNHQVEVSSEVLADQCRQILQEFFRRRRTDLAAEKASASEDR